jgi:hypothetical protein
LYLEEKSFAPPAVSNNTWTLEEDWALLDKVPQFTVGESSQARTFWSQLSASTPELASRSEDELMSRYETLSQGSQKSLPRAGESPPILQQWSLDDASGKFIGVYNGRTVWLQSQMVGRINNNAGSSDLPEVMKAVPGGFVEAVGGRVYELGQPKTTNSATDAVATVVSSDKGESLQLPKIFSTAKAGAVSVVVASAVVLSAALRYGAGYSSLQQQPLAPTHPIVAIVVNKKIVTPRRDVAVEINGAKQSVSEKRARKEAQVLRDERVMKALSQKLQQDRSTFEKLRIQEASASAVSDNIEQQSVSEQRARTEARVLREERVIKMISDRFPKEQADLQKLRAEEASQLLFRQGPN